MCDKEEDGAPRPFKKSSDAAESSCKMLTKKKRSASMFIPTCAKGSFDYETLRVAHTGPLQSVEENSSVSITVSGLLTQKENKESEMGNRPQVHKHLQTSGPLGLCNNPYCMTCPTHYRVNKKEVQEKNRRDHTHKSADQKFQNNQEGEPNKWTRIFLFLNIPEFVNPHSKFAHWWNKIFLISCLLATFIDPLFFFLLSVQQENKCVVFDWTLAWVVVGLRSLTDIIYFLHILLQFKLAYIAPATRVAGAGVLVDDPKKIARNYISGWFWIDLFVTLPLPQITTLFVQSNLLFFGANETKTILGLVVLFQYVPRLCRFLPMLAGQSTSGFIFETGWANFVINLLSFLLAGHIVGSSWYLFGIQRVNRCLKNACNVSDLSPCKKLIDCGHVSDKDDLGLLRNPDAWRNNVHAVSCFNEDGFRYGIYLQAVNLTTEPSVVTRYIYSLFWGFQQISTLAGNQLPSYYVWEVLFTMAIVGFGLLLFALLIGNMQNFLQALGRRRLEMMLRGRDVDQWMSHRRLPDEIKRKVREAERYNWMANRGVDEEKLMVKLPEDLQADIRRHLFNLKKVRIFSAMDEPVLDSISERLRQKTYIKGCQILFPRGPINKMTFIVRGEMKSIGEDGYVTQLSAEDVCGEELLTWCLEDIFGNQVAKQRRITGEKPISNRTVTCSSNVDAFTLGAADLEEVVCLFAKFLQNPRVQEAIRFESPIMRILAAKRIQAAWRNRKKRLNLSNAAGVTR
uniref:Cyclic nucleotide-binding domain-containing protein n=1 Tax=Kalanchoe fedtschenkoi TaxID=63787 RepID=A0A7N0U3V6_KALFE